MTDRRAMAREVRGTWAAARWLLPRHLKHLRRRTPGALGRLSRPVSRSSNALGASAIVGGLDSDIQLMEGFGIDVRRARGWAERHKRRFIEQWASNPEEYSALVRRGLEETYAEWERSLLAVDPEAGAFPYGPQYGHDHGEWEFEDDVFGRREIVEDAAILANRLRLAEAFQGYLNRFRALDDRLRRAIPFAVVKIMEIGGTIRPVEVFRAHWWWRRLAWEEFARRGGTWPGPRFR